MTWEILRRLRHRFPMLLVDRVEEVVPGQSLVAVKAVSGNEPWCVDLGDFPATLLLESWCQAAVLLAGWEGLERDRVMLLGAVADVEFHRGVTPGCLVRHSVRVLDVRGGTAVLGGLSEVGGEVVMTVGRVVTTSRAVEDLDS